MARLRPLVFSLVVLTLLAGIGLGLREMAVSESPPRQPPSQEEIATLVAANDERAREALRQFIEQGGDPCSLEWRDFTELPPLYASFDALINDADAIVVGHPTAHEMLPPAEDSNASVLLTTIEVEDVLAGAPVDSIVQLNMGRIVGYPTDPPIRSSSKLDLCQAGDLLLFLRQTGDGTYGFAYEGWALLQPGVVTAAPDNDFLAAYDSADALLADVRTIAAEQQAQGLPKGRLACLSRADRGYVGPLVCPGDTFSPYETYRLDTAAGVVISMPDPSILGHQSTDLSADDPRLTALLATLNTQVTLEPAPPAQDDLVNVGVNQDPPGTATSFGFRYSPSAGVIRFDAANGQFAAPAAFREAMAPLIEDLQRRVAE